MNKRDLLRAALGAAGMWGAGGGVRAEQALELTIAAVHPTTTPWVKLIAEQFVPEVRQRVAALGRGLSVDWSEHYGGSLYKMNAALTSVSDRITDIGWVLIASEASRLPLSQYSSTMPFACADMRVTLDVITELNASIPELAEEWGHNGLVFLGANTTDSYQLFTKVPVPGYEALRGRRVSAPGALGLWLKGSGAVAVDGSLASYYTDIQTGVSEGTVSIPTGIVPMRIHEVAPYVALVDVGCFFGGGLAMNKDRFLDLPPQVQEILRQAGLNYSRAVVELQAQRYDESLRILQAQASKSAVTLTRWSQAERIQWARSLPNLAGDWVRQHRSPALARRIVHAYMDGLRRRGAKPLRDWDREL